MVKYFCDICGKEIPPDAESHKRLKRTVGRLSFEVLTAIDSVWNAGHVCHDCIVAAINLRGDIPGPMSTSDGVKWFSVPRSSSAGGQDGAA